MTNRRRFPAWPAWHRSAAAASVLALCALGWVYGCGSSSGGTSPGSGGGPDGSQGGSSSGSASDGGEPEGGSSGNGGPYLDGTGGSSSSGGMVFTCPGCFDLTGHCQNGTANDMCGLGFETGSPTCVDCTAFNQVCGSTGECVNGSSGAGSSSSGGSSASSSSGGSDAGGG